MDSGCRSSLLVILLWSVILVVCASTLSRSQQVNQGTWNGEEIEYLDGQLRLRIAEGVSENDFTQLVDQIDGSILKSPDVLGWALVELPPNSDVYDMIEYLMESPLVEFCGPNVVGHALFDPNDEYFLTDQWALYNHFGDYCDPSQLYCCVAGEDINVRKAWDISRGSLTIPIAILDSGIPLAGDSLDQPPFVVPMQELVFSSIQALAS